MNTAKTSKAGKPRKVRGTATFHEDTGDMEFRACQPGEPVQKNVKRVKGSSFYETEGTKESSYVAHLKVPKTSADPVAEMFEQLAEGTKRLQTKEPPKPKGQRLLDEPRLTVILNNKERNVSVRMTIDLTEEGELSAKLFNLTSEVNKCFAINQKRLTRTT